MALAVAVTLGACGGDSGRGDAEADLAHFYEVFEDAGFEFQVASTCHLPREREDESWSLEVRIDVEASALEIADALEETGSAVRRDRDPMDVDQVRGDPADHWNGAIERLADDRSRLGLTNNNVAIGGLEEAGGWAAVCQDDR